MEWNEIKKSGDIFEVKDYLKNHKDGEFLDEARSVYSDMRQKLLAEMKANPTRFDLTMVQDYLYDGIFTREELMEEGLATNRTLDSLPAREYLGGIPADAYNYADIDTHVVGTDIYFFGIPNAGKTSLLMGLVNAVESGLMINVRRNGGQYADTLRQYAEMGVPFQCTPDKFIMTMTGEIIENRHNRELRHKVNFVEMSGQGLVHSIVNDDRPEMAEVGAVANNLLRNANRKVLFILVDPTTDSLTYYYPTKFYDQDGNVIDERYSKKDISQQEFLWWFVNRLALNENKDLMKKVDAIHFIVTKADSLGRTQQERNKKASDLLWDKYSSVVKNLCDLCHKAKINSTTDGKPCVFTYSIGRFYLGNLFEYDSADSKYLIEALCHLTRGTRESGLRKLLGMPPATVNPVPGNSGVKIKFR